MFDEGFAEILNVDFRGADGQGFLFYGVQVFALAEIRAKGDDVRLIFLSQPVQNHRGIQPTRIGEHDSIDC